MITRIQYALVKMTAKTAIGGMIERMNTEHPTILFTEQNSISDTTGENFRYYIDFATYGDKIYTKQIHFSATGYTEESLKTGRSIESIMRKDIFTINNFMRSPTIIGTDVPQFAYFTHN